MYFVPCWGVNKKVWPYYYCQKCVKSKEDVLREIDDEEYGFGIAFVDDFPGRFPTKASSPMPDPNGTWFKISNDNLLITTKGRK